MFDLIQFESYRVMPIRIDRAGTLEDEGHTPYVAMAYCEAEEATAWAVEGVLPKEFWQDDLPATRHICECLDQSVAYYILGLIYREAQFLVEQAYRAEVAKEIKIRNARME